MRIAAFILAAVLAASGATSLAWSVTHPRVQTSVVRVPVPGPTHTVVRTRTRIRWRTRRITTYDPAETACIANLWASYVNLADGGPAGDPSLFQADCPGVHINGLVTP